jgi:hypothetical protein
MQASNQRLELIRHVRQIGTHGGWFSASANAMCRPVRAPLPADFSDTLSINFSGTGQPQQVLQLVDAFPVHRGPPDTGSHFPHQRK